MPSSPFASYGRKSSVERTYRYIARMIDLKEVLPGERLPPADEIARAVEVSKPVVLEALKRLQAEGRVSVRAGLGGVKVLGAEGPNEELLVKWALQHRQTISEMTVLRQILEPAVVRMVVEQGVDGGLLDRLIELHEQMRVAEHSNDHRRLDTRFHLAIAAAVGNDVLEELVVQARQWSAPALDLPKWPGEWKATSNHGHQTILDAMAAADADAAEAAMREHIGVSTDRIAQWFDETEAAPRPRKRRPRRSGPS